jgi:hypothetical protein
MDPVCGADALSLVEVNIDILLQDLVVSVLVEHDQPGLAIGRCGRWDKRLWGCRWQVRDGRFCGSLGRRGHDRRNIAHVARVTAAARENEEKETKAQGYESQAAHEQN